MNKKFINNPVETYENLKRENERLKRENEIITGMCNSASNRFGKLYNTLQEIKTIAEKELSYDMVGNEHRHYKNYDIIRHLITKAEEE